MGTSQSSHGSPSGVPMVPPYVHPIEPGELDPAMVPGPETRLEPLEQPTPIAMPGRFGPCRTNLGCFASTGSNDSLRRGIAHYVGGRGRGLGGSRTATHRFGSTVSTAGTLFHALFSPASVNVKTIDKEFSLSSVANRPAHEIIDAIVEAVRPIDGTLDAETSRRSIQDTLSELLNRFPDADLLSLAEEHKNFVVERFVASDIYARFRLDVGKSIQDRSPSATIALSRLREVRDFIRETVSASFRRINATGRTLDLNNIVRVVSDAIRITLQVFEEFIL